MIILETNNKWYDKLLNSFPFCIDDRYVKTIAFAWLFIEDCWWHFKPRLVKENWQYTNAVFSIRFGLPFAFFMQLRFSTKWLFQTGIGWKQSGRFAIHCRVQTDASSAAGYHPNSPNTDQATGFNYGAH